jgi:hypothetical protein
VAPLWLPRLVRVRALSATTKPSSSCRAVLLAAVLPSSLPADEPGRLALLPLPLATAAGALAAAAAPLPLLRPLLGAAAPAPPLVRRAAAPTSPMVMASAACCCSSAMRCAQ